MRQFLWFILTQEMKIKGYISTVRLLQQLADMARQGNEEAQQTLIALLLPL
jgi:hypothetical protein